MDLREAAQQALEFIVASNKGSPFWLVPASNLNKTVTALRAALAEPEQEPVAWMWEYRRLDGHIETVTTYRKQHHHKELEFILAGLGEDAIPLYTEDPLQNIHPKTGLTACLMRSPEFRVNTLVRK